MHLLKIVGLLVGLTLSASGFAAEYSLEAAAEAAGEMIPKDGPTEVGLYNLPSPGRKGNARQLLEFLRAGRASGAYLIITTAKNEYARDQLIEALKRGKKNEKFTGLKLIIAGDRIDAAMFESVFKDRDVALLYAAY